MSDDVIIPGRIMRSVFTVGTAATIGQVLLMLNSFLVARWLGPERYAVIVANYSICAISSVLIDFGLDTWLLRKDADGKPLKIAAGHVIAIKLLAGVLWGTLIWGILPVIKPNVFIRSVLIFAIFNTIFNSTMNVLYMVLFKDNKFKTSSIILIGARVSRLLSAILLILFQVINIYAFITARIVIDVLFLGIAWIFVTPIMKFKGFKRRKNIMTESVPYSISDAITIIYNQSDVNLVSLLTDNLSMISYFSVAINLVNAIFAIIQTLQNVLIPTLSKLFEKRSNKLIKSIILTLAGFTAIGLILWLGTAIFGERLVNIAMGKYYLLSGAYIKKISPIFLIRSLSVGLTIILISINLQKYRIVPQVIATMVKIMLGVILFSSLKIEGMLWGYILSEFVMLVGLFWVLIKWFYNKREQMKNGLQV